MFRFIDLFAGIGGIRMAFESCGGACVYSSEWDKFCQETYLANFGDIPHGDIRSVKAEEMPEFDVMCAGFPCQPFSIAGVSKKKSLGRKHGFEDEKQGNLFFEMLRIIQYHKPRLLFLENVKNLMSHDQGRTFGIICNALLNEGYHIDTNVFDAAHFVPQHRERTIIVGYLDKHVSLPRKEELPSRSLSVKDILEKKVDSKYTLSDKLWTYLQEYAKKHREKGNGFGFGIADPKGITRTLSARYYKDGSEILISQKNMNPRRLTPRECARLQGYPDAYKIPVSDTQAYKQFGNSVCVPLMTYLADYVVSQTSLRDSPISSSKKTDALVTA